MRLGIVIFAAAAPAARSPGADVLRAAVATPHAMWAWATVAGGAFGVVAFFSVFIFLFKGRSATFAGLVNRLVSLVAGTAATLLSALLLGGKWPELTDWISLGFIFVAVGFLARAERRAVALEMAA